MGMKVTVNEPFSIEEYCGKIAIIYSSHDEEDLKDFFGAITKSGYGIIKNPIDNENVKGSRYVYEWNEQLKLAKVLIVVFSDNLLSSDLVRRIVWYQMGYMEHLKKEHTIPVVFTSDPTSFYSKHNTSGWPTSHLNYVNIYDKEQTDGLVSTLEKSFSSELLSLDLFDDEVLNYHVPYRLRYQRVIIRWDIEESVINDINEEYQEQEEEDLFENGKNAILDNIQTGVEILRFGYDASDVKLAIYKNEMDVKDNLTFPNNFECKKWMDKVSKDGDNKYSLFLEFVFPVHTPMGVTIKPFIKWKNYKTFWVLKDLFKKSLDSEEYAKRDVFFKENDNEDIDNVAYFRFVIKEGKERDKEALESWNVGSMCEFVFPQ